MAQQPVAVSYCTTCKGRLWQLRQTLEHNLAVIAPDEELVLVDFRSPDGLAPWIWGNFRAAITAGHLRFFEVLDEAPWHVSKAKNLAHRLARGTYLFNLDADNFLSPQDRQLVRLAMNHGRGCRQGSGDLRDGTPGRIGMPREAFLEIGGYDEGLLGMLAQDYDLIVRAEAAGHVFSRLPPPAQLPLQNDISQKLEHYLGKATSDRSDLAKIGRANMALSKLRLELEGPCRRQNFSTYRGRWNGVDSIFDGLGNLTPVV